MIKRLLLVFYPSHDLSLRTISALALRARADMVYSGSDHDWDQNNHVIIYMYNISYE